MTAEIGFALCVTVRNQGEYGAFFVRETQRGEGSSKHFMCELTIQSSFGNVGYFWGHMGRYAHEFFDTDDKHYILGKLFGDRAYVFDLDNTIRDIKKRIIEQRRHGICTPARAREYWEDLRWLEEAYTEQELYHQLYENAAHLSRLIEPSDLAVCRMLNPQAEGLWTMLWPEFVQALKQRWFDTHCEVCGGRKAKYIGESDHHTKDCTKPRPIPF